MQVGVIVKSGLAGRAQCDLRWHTTNVCLIDRPVVSAESASAVSACLVRIIDFFLNVADIDLRKNIVAVTSDRNGACAIAV